MLEFSYITNRLRSANLFAELGLANPADEPGAAPMWRDPHQCLAGACAQQGLLFGKTALLLRAAPDVEIKGMVYEGLNYLVMHELGHTLGLNHNFKGSLLFDPVTIHKREITEKTGLTGSVMDYPPANIAPMGVTQGQYYTLKPGPYDHWAIEYGYSEALDDGPLEEKRLATIAPRSHAPELAFANDADDMRKPGKGIDPRAMIFDMSSDPLTYGKQRCELVKAKLDSLLKAGPEEGKSWQAVTQAYVTLTTEAANALTAVSRYVGGVYVERAFVGQAPDKKPYTPVEKEKQRQALAILAECAFGPEAWHLPPELASHLQQQRRGFDFSREDEDPRLHERVGKLQRALLDQLLHADTQQRILDSALYGNEVSLREVMFSLTKGVFEGDPEASGPDSLRQNLQTEYVERLLKIVNSSAYMPAAQAVAFQNLQDIRAKLQARNGPFAVPPARAHAAFLEYKIRRGLDERN